MNKLIGLPFYVFLLAGCVVNADPQIGTTYYTEMLYGIPSGVVALLAAWRFIRIRRKERERVERIIQERRLRENERMEKERIAQIEREAELENRARKVEAMAREEERERKRSQEFQRLIRSIGEGTSIGLGDRM